METNTQIFNLAALLGSFPIGNEGLVNNNVTQQNAGVNFPDILDKSLLGLIETPKQPAMTALPGSIQPSLIDILDTAGIVENEQPNEQSNMISLNASAMQANGMVQIPSMMTAQLGLNPVNIEPVQNGDIDYINLPTEPVKETNAASPSITNVLNQNISESGDRVSFQIAQTVLKDMGLNVVTKEPKKTEIKFNSNNDDNSLELQTALINAVTDKFGKPAILRTNMAPQIAGLKPISGMGEAAAGVRVSETSIYNVEKQPADIPTPRSAELQTAASPLPTIETPVDGKIQFKDSKKAADNVRSIQKDVSPALVEVSKPVEHVAPAAVPEKNPSIIPDKQKEFIELGKVIDNSNPANVTADKNNILSANTVNKVIATPAENQAPEVRFVIPQELTKGNVKNGQVVIIKMEPENLGSLRLILSTHQDNVSGRLIVENNAVRSLVESNLDNLYDQLSRHGIRLENFEVALNAGQGGHRFGQSRSSEDGRINGRMKKYFDDIKSSVQSTPIISRGRMYIGATGVNWMA